MKMRDRTVLAVMLLVGFTTGEASARSTCRAKLQIGGAAAPGKGVMARCTDGTAACDSDGAADGGCTFSVSLCFDQGGASCSPDDVRQASIVPGAGFEGISAAMEALKGDAAPVCTAAGELRVAPGDPDHSFLLRKLLGQIAPAEGSRMPLVGTPPSAANLDLIRRWIAAGAPETAPF